SLSLPTRRSSDLGKSRSRSEPGETSGAKAPAQRIRPAEIRADGLQVVRVVHQHIGRQLRRLLAENAAPAWAGRTEVVRRILVFGRLGSGWIVEDGDRSGALRIVDVATGIENDCPLSRAGVVGAQNEITRASVCHLRARRE